MQASREKPEHPSVRRERDPFLRTVVASRRIEAPFYDVERTMRICLGQLVATAFPPCQRGRNGLLAEIAVLHWPRWLQVPVAVEVESARHTKPGQIAHLQWRAWRHPRLFPVMEADLLLQPSTGQSSELVPGGRYHPPLGLLGALGDLLVDRLIAQASVEAFINGLTRPQSRKATAQRPGTRQLVRVVG